MVSLSRIHQDVGRLSEVLIGTSVVTAAASRVGRVWGLWPIDMVVVVDFDLADAAPRLGDDGQPGEVSQSLVLQRQRAESAR